MLPAQNRQYATSWNFMLTGSDGGTYTLVDGFALGTKPNAQVSASLAPIHIDRTYSRGKGPAVADGSTKVVGHAVWYARDNSQEWALIRLDRGRRWSSVVCGYGRPRSVDTTIDSLPVTVAIYGQASDRTTRTQTDVLPYGRYAPDWVTKSVPVSSGDWSAPVISGDNQALGILSHVSGGGGRDYTHPVGPGGWVFRLQPLMERSGKRVGVQMSLPRSLAGVAT
jgi:hypothetical protein